MSTNVNAVEVLNKLDERRKSVIVQIMLDMLQAQQNEEDFDYLSPDDIASIERARGERERGETLHFDSADEALAHWGFHP